MANNERLTKRVKKIEEWMADNEEMGGPKGYLDTVVHMYNTNAQMSVNFNNVRRDFDSMRKLTFEFIEMNKLTDEWNAFLEEKDALQKQQAEEVSVEEEAESGEEVSETSKENKKE